MARLRLGGLGRLVLEAVDEAFKLFLLPVEIALLGDKLFVPGNPGLTVVRVVSGIACHMPAHHLEGDICERIEQIPVVGDQQQGSAIPLQIVREPFHGGDVEVVCRFVQHQDVRL